MKPAAISGVTLCMALIALSCATTPPGGCGFASAKRVDLEAVDGEVALRLEPRGRSIRVEGRNGLPVATVRCDALGLVVDRSDDGASWLIEPPDRDGRRYFVKSARDADVGFEVKLDPDGDIEIRDASGVSLNKLKRRDYGFKVVSSDGRDLARVRTRPGKISVRDGNDTTYLTTRADIPLEAAALLIVEVLPMEVAAGLAVALAFWTPDPMKMDRTSME